MSKSSALPDHLLKSLLLLTAWTLTGLIGMLGYERFGGTSPAWPASGVGVGLLVLWGPRYWPAIALGSILVSLAGGVSPVVYVPLAFTNTIEAAGSAWVLRRLGFDPSLSRPREVVRLAIVGVLFCIFSAIVGVSVLKYIGAIHPGDELLKGIVWGVGNFLGLLLVAPTVLVWSQPGLRRLGTARWIEVMVLVAVLATVCLLVFFQPARPTASMPLAFLTIPFVVVAAMRYGLRGGTLATLAICGVALVSTALKWGVFVSPDLRTTTAILMTFEGMLVLTALFVGSTTADQRRHTDELRQHEAIFHGLAEANQLLLASTAWSDTAPQVLATLGPALRLDRAALYQTVVDASGRVTVRNIHRWDAGESPASAKHPLSAEISTDLPGTAPWVAEFRAGRLVTVLASQATGGGAALLARLGIRSVAAAPIMIDGQCWGFLALSDCQSPRAWSAQERAIAQTVATNFGIAIRRDELREELADSVTRYRALLSALPDTYILHDREGRVLDLHRNQPGDTPPPADAGPGDTSLPPGTAALIRDGIAEVAEHGRPVLLQYSVQTPGGLRYFERRIVRAEGSKLLTIQRDVTELRQAEVERAQMEHKLREAQRLESLGVLAGGIAHDFNNLLTAILGNVSLVRLNLPADTIATPMLKQIESASLRAADLCRQMLAYAGRGQLVVDHADLSQLVHDTTSLLQVSLSQRARLELDLAPRPLPVLVDATQVRQVLMNLIINAAEAMGPQGGQVTLHTGVMHADAAYLTACRSAGDVAPGEFCFIEVADTGTGMNAETLARIFDPFFTTKFTGRGLGLAAVLGIVQGHRGALHVVSAPGRGSTFRVLLPLAQDGGAPAAAAPAAAPAATRARSGRVLVVDDEAQVRDTSSLMLERLGYRTATVDSGEKALAAFRARPDEFKFVLLDLTMPNMDGRQTLTALRELNPTVPVLIMSGYDEQESSHRLQGGEVQGFLPKPFTYESLQARLERAGL